MEEKEDEAGEDLSTFPLFFGIRQLIRAPVETH
jgi:hypothetical protein